MFEHLKGIKCYGLKLIKTEVYETYSFIMLMERGAWETKVVVT